MIRLAHFSDIHLWANSLWSPRDWFSKRLTGWINIRLLGRGKRFAHADRVVAALVREFETQAFDRLIFSGDAVMIAFDREFAKAAQALNIDRFPGLAVPGNHDHYIHQVVRRARFEHYFAPWLVGERADPKWTYPFAQRVGPVWLIGLNSSRANFWNWDASGEVGFAQRRRLAELLGRLEPGPRILVTHYPAVMPDGTPEPFFHQLRDWEEVVRVAHAGGVGLWLNGHRHVGYRLETSAVLPFPMVNVGSSTQTDRWSYNEYAIEGVHLTGIRRMYSLDRDQFEEVERFAFDLPVQADSTK